MKIPQCRSESWIEQSALSRDKSVSLRGCRRHSGRCSRGAGAWFGLAGVRHALAAWFGGAVVFRLRAARAGRAAVGDPRRRRRPGGRAGHRRHDGLHRPGPAVDAPRAGRPGVALDADARIRTARIARSRAPPHRPAVGCHGAGRAARTGFGIVTVCGATAVAAFVEPRRRGRPSAPSAWPVPLLSSPLSRPRPGLPGGGFGLVFVLAVVPALAIPLAWPIARAIGDSDRAPADGAGGGTAAALWHALSGPLVALAVITAAGGAILTFTPHILASPALGFLGLLAFTGAAAASRWTSGGIADRFGPTPAIRSPAAVHGRAGACLDRAGSGQRS